MLKIILDIVFSVVVSIIILIGVIIVAKILSISNEVDTAAVALMSIPVFIKLRRYKASIKTKNPPVKAG